MSASKDRKIREMHAEIERLRGVNSGLRTVMIAAAEEIHEHWAAHCDAEGYGPANLMRRLEDGIPAEYGYTAGAFARLTAEREALREALQAAYDALSISYPLHSCDMDKRGTVLSQARAALAQGKEPSNPKGLARSDADYWIRSRAAILQAIADRGLMLVSNKDGFCLMEAGKMQAQPKEPSNG